MTLNWRQCTSYLPFSIYISLLVSNSRKQHDVSCSVSGQRIHAFQRERERERQRCWKKRVRATEELNRKQKCEHFILSACCMLQRWFITTILQENRFDSNQYSFVTSISVCLYQNFKVFVWAFEILFLRSCSLNTVSWN